MRSFVTGVDGFIGSHLAEALVAAGDEVYGLSRSNAAERSDAVVRFQGDVSSADAVERAVAQAKPDRVFHLAAQNNIQASFADPGTTLQANVQGSLHVFDAVRKTCPLAVVVSVGSSAEYGRTAAGHDAIGEDLPLAPTSPYGVSKAAQGMLCAVYATVHGLRALHVRPFAIIGPRKTKDALSDFCRNVVAIERGESDRFLVGPLASVRDFVDVRDCVAALVLLSERGATGGVYNLCNGSGVRLSEIVASLQRVSRRPFEPVADPSRLRAADDSRIIGDPSRLVALGYGARYSLDDTIAATLDYWRARPSA
jgi:GDP-4-dehydro-6-deoxy-D-mannose reductase